MPAVAPPADAGRPTWEACHAAGMTAPAAAAARGVSRSAAHSAAVARGFAWPGCARRGTWYRRAGGPTWAECAAAGMTLREAAAARGVSVTAAYNAARRGLVFRPAPRARQERLPAAVRAALSARERADYQLLRRHGFGLAEALVGIGRAELVPPPGA